MASFTGSRSKYVYESEGGLSYALLLDDELAAISGLSLVVVTTQDVQAKPQRFKPRGVYWQADTGQRKFLVCGSAGASLYATNSSSTLTIDGIAGKITGRVGEKQTF